MWIEADVTSQKKLPRTTKIRDLKKKANSVELFFYLILSVELWEVVSCLDVELLYGNLPGGHVFVFLFGLKVFF
jgi:hypothetical protein